MTATGSMRPVANYSTLDNTPEEARTILEEARSRCPVAHSDRQDGFHILLGYDDVKTATADHETFSSQPSTLRPLADRPPAPPIDFDPPAHSMWRPIFNLAFNPRASARVESLVKADAERAAEEFAQAGTGDLVADYCEKLPALAVCHVIGFDVDSRGESRKRVSELLSSLGEPEKAHRAFVDFNRYCIEQASDRKTNPRDDYLTELVNAEIDGRPISDLELSSVIAAILIAGIETTISGLGSLLYEVLADPSTQQRLRENPQLIPGAVEEALRLHPPVWGLYRRATCPVTMHGVDIKQDDTVMVNWAAANWDPATFEDPSAFRVDRKPNPHLTFGRGIHTCPGAHTARMEMRVGLTVLLNRFSDMRLPDGFKPTYLFGGAESASMVSLPAIFTPAG